MTSLSYVVLINPESGRKFNDKLRNQLTAELDRMGIDYEIDAMEHLQTYDRTMVRLSNGFRNFVVVGGDGTLNQFVNALHSQNEVNPQDVKLCFIPSGTGNDWRRTTNVPLDLKKAVQLIREGKDFRQDVGVVRYCSGGVIKTHYFANIAGMAYDAYVNYHTTLGNSKKKLGKLSYLLKILSCLFSYRKTTVTYTMDGKAFSHKVFSLCVGICKFNGNGIKQLPHAVADDGKLSVMVIGNLSTAQVLMQMPKMYSGSFVNHPQIETFDCVTMKVESDEKIYLECDGEQLGHSPFEFEIIPGGLCVKVP